MKPTGIEKLTPDNATLYRRVQHLVRLQKSWEEIAFMVDVPNVKELCDWVLAYKEPKDNVFRNSGYIHTVPVKTDYKPDAQRMTQQFLAWKKQQEGAKEALRAFEFGPGM